MKSTRAETRQRGHATGQGNECDESGAKHREKDREGGNENVIRVMRGRLQDRQARVKGEYTGTEKESYTGSEN
jgi:hypothetical protein